MRKVVRKKDKYVRGQYEISNVTLDILKKSKSEVEGQSWYTVYALPEQHVQNFKRRHTLKTLVQVPPFAFFAKFLYA